MGSCVSMHKDPKSAMKIRLVFASKTDKLVNPSPVKDHNKPLDNGDIKLQNPSVKLRQRSPVPPKTSFSDYGSKEEAFFDSQAWLESDCEDDFYSVRGDFTPSVGNTPSCGNTPVHRGSSARNRTPFLEKPPTSLPQSCPSIKRKKLFELFKDSIRHQNANEQDAEPNLNGTGADKEAKLSCLQLPPKSTSNTTASRGKKTPNRAFKTEPNSPKSQCCLPRLRSSGSFGGRSKSTSPAHSVG